jgi:NADPH-dependent ferric siderophore reductase
MRQQRACNAVAFVLDTNNVNRSSNAMSASSSPAIQDHAAERAPRRVRHEPRRRELNVQRVERVSAHMTRVTFGGDLHGFTSLGFDDHVKMFFPDGPVAPDGAQPTAGRDYTPRRYDAAANTLEVDFVLHDAGPATRWAEQAQPGQTLSIGGPRGSFIIPTNFDWHLLIGDDTALPAISRRLAELPAGTRTVVLAEVDGPADEMAFETAADVTVTWAHRNGTEAGSSDVLSRTLRTLALPNGDYYAWVACDSPTAKVLRTQLIAEHGANPKWTKAAGYWRRGAVAVHERHDD